MESSNTSPHIIKFIYEGLRHWTTHQPNHHSPLHTILSTSPTINSSLTSQLHLGWYNTLCGFLTTKFISLQQQHFTSINSRQTASKWGSILISKFWNIIYSMWTHRNSSLHDSERINQLSGYNTLLQSITREHQTGLGDLPTIFSSYFHQPLPLLLSRSTYYLKNWFLLIRAARECHQPEIYNDDFSSDGPLRLWVGLKPTN